jgi:hypothetical protein
MAVAEIIEVTKNGSTVVEVIERGPQGPVGPQGLEGFDDAPEDGVIYGRKDANWVDMTSPANLQVRRGTAAEVAAITPLQGEPIWATDTKRLVVGDGTTAGGIPIGLYDSSSCIICKVGDSFSEKYAAAKALSPNGSAKSDTNRATLVVLPGTYSVASEVTIDGEFVDIVGIGALRTQRGCLPLVNLDHSTSGVALNVTANNVRIFGIRVIVGSWSIASDKPLRVFDCCRSSFISDWNAAIVNGTFINCQTDGNSGFAGGGIQDAAGTFINCTGSFGGGFGAGAGGASSGTFINCAGAFGLQTCSGTFWHCEGRFDPIGNLSGKLYYCRKTIGTTFKALTAPGAIRFCIDGAGTAQTNIDP